MWWWWHGSMSWMMLWPLGFIVVCIVMVMLMMHGDGMRMPPWRKDPLEILRERFARGENDSREHEDRKRLLSQH
jgi:uncharacterized membrane protein